MIRVDSISDYVWWRWAAWIDYGLCETRYIEIKAWLESNLPQNQYSYDYTNVVLFRNREQALLFKMVWGEI